MWGPEPSPIAKIILAKALNILNVRKLIKGSGDSDADDPVGRFVLDAIDDGILEDTTDDLPIN